MVKRRRIVLELGESTSATHCGDCENLRFSPGRRHGPDQMVCRLYGSRPMSKRRAKECIEREAAMERMVEIAPAVVRAAIESLDDFGATHVVPEWAPIVDVLREHGVKR